MLPLQERLAPDAATLTTAGELAPQARFTLLLTKGFDCFRCLWARGHLTVTLVSVSRPGRRDLTRV